MSTTLILRLLKIKDARWWRVVVGAPRPSVDDEQEAFAALADGVDDDNDDPGETEQFEALADGLGDVDESPTEQAEFAALADGLGDDGE